MDTTRSPALWALALFSDTESHVRDKFIAGMRCGDRSCYGRNTNEAIPDSIISKWSHCFVTAFTEIHRHHDTLVDLNAMFKIYASLRLDLHSNREPSLGAKNVTHDTIVLFIFFHDWVTEPKSPHGQNESRSIKVFEEFAVDIDLNHDTRASVTRCIQASSTHEYHPSSSGSEVENAEMALCLDLDLAILGREKVDYFRYANQNRRKYGHLSSIEYAKRRIVSLQKILGKGTVYFTDDFCLRYEANARSNMEWEIKELEKKLSKDPIAVHFG